MTTPAPSAESVESPSSALSAEGAELLREEGLVPEMKFKRLREAYHDALLFNYGSTGITRLFFGIWATIACVLAVVVCVAIPIALGALLSSVIARIVEAM